MKFSKIKEYLQRIKTERRERNRFWLLLFSLMICADYLMFCLHTGRNPLAVFPPFPVRDSRENITLFLPNPDGTNMLEEKRRISLSGNTEHDVHSILMLISRGSRYENTMPTVPVKLLPRQIWVRDGECVIDLSHMFVSDDKAVISGSEKMFREALTKSITENFPGIKTVTIINNGVYGLSLWKD